MEKRRFITSLLVTAIIATACPASALVVDKSACGQVVTLNQGQRLEVVLPGNPTAGFLWLPPTPLPPTLRQEGERSFKRDSNLAGAGGHFTFHFVAQGEGEEELKLVYRRPWEEDAPPAESCSFTVTVKKKEGQVSTVYLSPKGEQMEARFDLPAQSVTVVLAGGRSVTLPAAVSASGARYSNGTETFWEHQGSGRFFINENLVFEGSQRTGDLPPPDSGVAGEWYETGYLQRLKSTRSPCRALPKNGAPRITVRQEGTNLVADLEYRFHEKISVRLGRAATNGGTVTVRRDPAKPAVLEQLVWKTKPTPSLSLIRTEVKGKQGKGKSAKKKRGKGKQVVAHYRLLSRQELNRMVVAGEYRSTAGVLEQTVSITPDGRFESPSFSFDYDLGFDCTFAVCNYLQARNGAKDPNGFPLRYGFSRTGTTLLLLPVRYEGNERLVCDKKPLMRLRLK